MIIALPSRFQSSVYSLVNVESWVMQFEVFNKHFPKHSQGSFGWVRKHSFEVHHNTTFVYLLPGSHSSEFPPKLFFNRSRWLFRQKSVFYLYNFLLFYYYCSTITVSIIIKIIIKSKARLVFSNVLIRMIRKSQIFHHSESPLSKSVKLFFYFVYLIVTEKEENPEPLRGAQKNIFSLWLVSYESTTPREKYFISPRKTFGVLFLLLLEKKNELHWELKCYSWKYL
jgi:hypothetical protein